MDKPEDTTRGMNALLMHQSHEQMIPVGAMVDAGSIERMEAEGQKQLVASTALPVRVNDDKARTEALMVKWGFELGSADKDDKLFRQAKLPPGWKREGTDHSMWSKIVDDKGRERVSIFYKAAFYDRDAFMSLIGRYGSDFCTKEEEAFAREDVKKLDPSKIFRFPLKDERVSIMIPIDRQTGEVLGMYIGDYGAVADACRAFMAERIGDKDAWGPDLWTE